MVGPWYRDALRKLGIQFQVVSGGIRNYIERWYKTFKRRIKSLDRCFPHRREYGHITYWINAFVFYFNRIRKHMSLGCRTPMEFFEEVLN